MAEHCYRLVCSYMYENGHTFLILVRHCISCLNFHTGHYVAVIQWFKTVACKLISQAENKPSATLLQAILNIFMPLVPVHFTGLFINLHHHVASVGRSLALCLHFMAIRHRSGGVAPESRFAVIVFFPKICSSMVSSSCTTLLTMHEGIPLSAAWGCRWVL